MLDIARCFGVDALDPCHSAGAFNLLTIQHEGENVGGIVWAHHEERCSAGLRVLIPQHDGHSRREAASDKFLEFLAHLAIQFSLDGLTIFFAHQLRKLLQGEISAAVGEVNDIGKVAHKLSDDLLDQLRRQALEATHGDTDLGDLTGREPREQPRGDSRVHKHHQRSGALRSGEVR